MKTVIKRLSQGEMDFCGSLVSNSKKLSYIKTRQSEETDMKNIDNNKENNGKTKKRLIYKVGLIICTIGFLITAGISVKNHIQEKKAQEQFESLSSQTTQEETNTEKIPEEPTDILAELGITVPEKELDWDALIETNEDIYAWIYIPNTSVDYPVLQHATENNYYLNRNLDHSEGRPGCIYTQVSYNSKDFMDFNTIMYGHNMRVGTMFATLHNFEDETFFDENEYIYIYTPEHTYVYEIFAAYTFDDRHILYAFDNESESDRTAYLEEIFSIRDMSAHFREDVEVTTEDNILTLSTCVNGSSNSRYLVQGVLVNPVEEN